MKCRAGRRLSQLDLATRSAFERDRRKAADLVTAGHRVLRSTWLAVEREPDRLARMLRAAPAS